MHRQGWRIPFDMTARKKNIKIESDASKEGTSTWRTGMLVYPTEQGKEEKKGGIRGNAIVSKKVKSKQECKKRIKSSVRCLPCSLPICSTRGFVIYAAGGERGGGGG